MKLCKSIFTKQIETDRSVQVVSFVWCECAWKMSVNSKGWTLSHVCADYKDVKLSTAVCNVQF